MADCVLNGVIALRDEADLSIPSPGKHGCELNE
jgi:hypothetical protein